MALDNMTPQQQRRLLELLKKQTQIPTVADITATPTDSSLPIVKEGQTNLPQSQDTDFLTKALSFTFSGASGDVFSGIAGRFFDPTEGNKLVEQAEQENPGFVEAVRRGGGGALSGATLGAIPVPEGTEGTVGSQVGQLLGFAAPIGVAAKGVGLASKAIGGTLGVAGRIGAAATPTAVKGLAHSTAIGATVSGFEQGVRAVKGEEFSVKQIGFEAGLFGLADLALRGAGKGLQKAIKNRDTKKAIELIELEIEKATLPPMTKEEIKMFSQHVVDKGGIPFLGKGKFVTEGNKKLPAYDPPPGDIATKDRPFVSNQRPVATREEVAPLLDIPATVVVPARFKSVNASIIAAPEPAPSE